MYEEKRQISIRDAVDRDNYTLFKLFNSNINDQSQMSVKTMSRQGRR